MEYIDLRSDTVTRPSEAMRAVMAGAEVGDDVYGEDPTVNRLESLAAEMLGKEAAVFTASGTQANLLALLTHCERGDEYIVGQTAHTYKYEGGGGAVLGSIQPQPLDFEEDGTLDLEKVAGVIKPADHHFARTRLLCLENTQGGKSLPAEYLEQAATLCRDRGLRMHLDGARIFNAAIDRKVPVTNISRHFDTVSFCLSKGLGAPVGSLMCGRGAQVESARRWRKVLGGGMRQAGLLAAAGIYALENNIERLAEDHANAALLAGGLAGIAGLATNAVSLHTNMVILRAGDAGITRLPAFLAERGVLVHGGAEMRLVTHLDIGGPDIQTVVETFRDFYEQHGTS